MIYNALIVVILLFTEDHSKPKFPSTELESRKEKNCPIILHIQQADEATKNAVQLFTKQVVLILHTCNQEEYWAALERLEPPTKEDGNKIQDHSVQYQPSGSVLGWFAGYRAAVVRTERGEKGCSSLETAIIESFPNVQVIIGTGIAYADRKHKFADVLISNQVEFIAQHMKEGGEITNQASRQEIDADVKKVLEDRGYIGVTNIKRLHPNVNCNAARATVLKTAQGGGRCWEYEGDYDATVGANCAIWEFSFADCTAEPWKNDYGCRSF